MNLLSSIFVISLFLINNPKSKQNDTVEVVKFMETYYYYSRDVDYHIFWGFPEEHAKLSIIHNFSIEEKFRKLPLANEDENFEFLTYAFIYKNGNKKDTIYADQTLKAFKKIRKIKKTDRLEETYYYDKNGEIATMLRNKFSFFKECW